MIRQAQRQRDINAYKYGVAGLPQPLQTAEDRLLAQRQAAIAAAAPTIANGRGLPILQPFYQNSAANNLRGQLGMQSPGRPPPAAPTVGDRPFPVDIFSVLGNLLNGTGSTASV